MDTYLLALGWWNFIGSILMIGFFNETFGRNMLNKWTKIFETKFVLDYWGKFWLAWAIGLNIFFGLINIYAVKWGYIEVKLFLIYFDIIAYSIFVGLSVWGQITKKCGSGIYSAYIIFAMWILWGIKSIL